MAIRAHAVGEEALIRPPRFHEHRAGAVAEERVGLDVVRVQHAAVGVAADDERPVAQAGLHIRRSGDERVHEAGAGGLNLDRRADQAEPVLHEARGRGERHVRREGAENEQVAVLRGLAGLGEEVVGGFDAQIGSGLVGGRVAAFQDAGALDDPVGVEAEAGVEVVVADDHVRDVLAGADDPDAHQDRHFGRGEVRSVLIGQHPHGMPVRAARRGREVVIISDAVPRSAGSGGYRGEVRARPRLVLLSSGGEKAEQTRDRNCVTVDPKIPIRR